MARCSLAGTPFTVVGTHLGHDPAERLAHVTQLLAEVEAFHGCDEDSAPQIVAGDFNEEPDGAVWKTLGEQFQDAARTGAGDATPTFSCDAPRRRIDAVFADPATAVERYEVLDSPDVRMASDHFPVLVELALPEG